MSRIFVDIYCTFIFVVRLYDDNDVSRHYMSTMGAGGLSYLHFIVLCCEWLVFIEGYNSYASISV